MKKYSTFVKLLNSNNDNRELNMNDSFLDNSNIHLLKRMFKDEDAYFEYMDTLWTMRALALKFCEDKDGNVNHRHPYYRIADICNQFIGALLKPDINFHFDGEKVYHTKDGRPYHNGNGN